jgi:hypothetical protein
MVLRRKATNTNAVVGTWTKAVWAHVRRSDQTRPKMTMNSKYVPNSLRHNTTDRQREADVPGRTQTSSMRHSMGKGEEGRHGGRLALTKRRNELVAAMTGYRTQVTKSSLGRGCVETRRQGLLGWALRTAGC